MLSSACLVLELTDELMTTAAPTRLGGVPLSTLGLLLLVCCLLIQGSHQIPFSKRIDYSSDRASLDGLGLTVEEHARPRLRKLRAISKRMSNYPQTKHDDTPLVRKKMAANYNDYMVNEFSAIVAKLLQALKQQQKEKNEKSTTRRAHPEMEEFRSSYIPFYNTLQTFVKQLPAHLKDDYPSGLDNVEVLADILKPNDPCFDDGDIDTLVRKFFIMHNVLDPLLKSGGTQVKDDSQIWFQGQSGNLQMELFMLKLTMTNLQLKGTPVSNDVNVMSSGVGGINTGVKQSLGYTTMLKLSKLVPALQRILKDST